MLQTRRLRRLARTIEIQLVKAVGALSLNGAVVQAERANRFHQLDLNKTQIVNCFT